MYLKTAYLVSSTTCVFFIFSFDGSTLYQMQPKKIFGKIFEPIKRDLVPGKIPKNLLS
jgi:hypothetical protein